jgi:hypothetical protein
MIHTTDVVPPLRPTAARVLAPDFGADLERLAGDPQVQLSAMREFLASPRVPVWAGDTLEKILKNPDHLTEIAAQSFAHPNGFDSIPLENRHPAYRVRLHVWWPEDALVTEDVHNHAWSFASRILSGALNFTTYRATDLGAPFFHYPWRLGDDGTYDSGAVRTVNLAPALNACLPTGVYYTFDLNELHRVAPVKTQQPVSTLVILGKMQRNGTDVYTEQPRHDAGYRLLKHPYAPGQLADRLRRYLGCL